MIKRALAAALCLMLVFALLPKTARAVMHPSKVHIGPYCELSSANQYYHNGDTENNNNEEGANAHYNPNTGVLTLTDLDVTDYTTLNGVAYFIYIEGNSSATLTIELKGSNFVQTNNVNNHKARAIWADSNITITGSGSLWALMPEDASECTGIFVSETLTINDGDIQGLGGRGASQGDIKSSNSIGVQAKSIIVSGGRLEGIACGTTNVANSTSYGVVADSIEVSGNGQIIGKGGEIGSLGTGKAEKSAGVYASSGSITASGGSITGTGGEATGTSGCSYGVFAGQNITANGGGITGTGGQASLGGSYGLYAASNLTLNSGRLAGKSTASGNTSRAMNKQPSDPLPASYYWRISETDPYTASTEALLSAGFSAGTYGDIRAVLPSKPSITVSVPAFALGQAPQNETVKINSDDDIDAIENFGSAAMDNVSIDLGKPNISGTQGRVENGSIVIRLYKAYLDTLAVGTHTLRVNLAGVYAGQYVETQITVMASGGGIGAGGDAGVDVPKTGDAATPALWLGLILLAGAGLAVSAVRRRKRQNG